MCPKVYGIEHILYIIITTIVAIIVLILLKKYAKDEKTKNIALKCIAALLFIAIVTNRLSQVFRYDNVRWDQIIPDSYCGMTSLVLSLAVLFGKRDNPVYHFLWLLGLFGGISTVAYPAFVGQNQSFFYIPTISGLLHHSLSASMVVALLMFKQIDITYKKWYYVLFGFTAYITIGAFQMAVFGYNDSFHIVEPLLSGTPLTTWVMAPMYIFGHGLIFLIIELVRNNLHKKM